MYTKSWWPHCVRARMRLRRKGLDFHEVKAGREVARARAELQERFGASTFPQIVIGDHHVGGADRLVALDRSGELDTLLERTPA